MHLACLHGNMAGPPGGDRPAVGADNRVVALIVHRVRERSPAVSSAHRDGWRAHHHLAPLLHSFLRLLQKTSVFFPLQARQQFTQTHGGCRPPDPTSTGNRRPIRFGSSSICTPCASPRFRQVLEIRKRRSDHQQNVATLHRLLGRPRTQQTDGSGRVLAVIRHSVPAQQCLDDRRASISAACSSSAVACSAPRPARIAIFFPPLRISAALSRSI